MNTFGLDIERLDPEEVKEALSTRGVEKLPGVPPFLSKPECAAILGVSMKVINHLVGTGELPFTDIPGDDAPAYPDLFGQTGEPPREVCILRADLTDFLEKSLLCNKPVFDLDNDR
jgi:hypothetical protein